MQAKQEKEFSLLQSDHGINGLYLYATGRNIDKEQKRQYNLISNFRTKGLNRDMFKLRIDSVAEHFGCKQIAILPSSGITHNSLQELFGADRIKRIVPIQNLSIDDNKLEAGHFSFNDTGEKTLLVGYVSKTGADLLWFSKQFRDPVLFAVGLHSLLNPRLNTKVETKPPKELRPKDAQTVINDVSDRAAFIAALKNGMGFTKSCNMILMDPKEMSKRIRENPEFFKECEQALKFSAKALLVMSNTYLEKKNFARWMSNNEFIKQYHSKLNLWECYRKRKEVESKDIIVGFKIYKDIAELSTAIGFSETELVEHISNNAELAVYFSDIGAI